MRRLSAFALCLAGCTLLQQSFEGRACSADHPCPGALACDPVQAICVSSLSGADGSVDGGPLACHLFDSETAVNCTGQDLYVSPTGSDTANGTSPSTPTATVGAHPITPGDRFHLAPGRYAAVVLTGNQVSGVAGCPVQVFGPDAGSDGGGMAILEKPIDFDADEWWIHDLRFETSSNQAAILVGGANNRVERLVMRNQYPANTYPRDFELSFDSLNTTIISCDSNSTNGQVLLASNGIGLRFIGNRVVASAAAQLQVSPGTLLEGNDLSGAWNSPLLMAPPGSGVVVIRNVFHDLVDINSNSLTVIDGADEVRSNSFIRIAQGTASTGGTFRDNLVSGLDVGVPTSAASVDAGYNLFENVGKPYASGAGLGDQSAPSLLDATFVPQAGSTAIDAADPALPVPPGGGTRADIGARERGAPLLPDGRYCVDGGG